MQMNLKVSLLTSLVLTTSVTLFAQRNNQAPPANPNAPGNTTQSATRNTGPRPYNEVITAKARTNKGLLTTHMVEDKYYFEIPDSVMNRELLVVNRIAKSAAGSRAGFLGYAGDPISDNVIAFERGPNNRIFLRSISYQEVGRDSAGGMYQSVLNSNLQPIVASFDIKALARDSATGARGAVIDVTDYLMGDNDIFFFSPRTKRALGLGAYQKDNSYIVNLKSFPSNTHISTVKTYMRTPPATLGQGGAPAPTMGAAATGTPTACLTAVSVIFLLPIPILT
jgi:hypothetical protein